MTHKIYCWVAAFLWSMNISYGQKLPEVHFEELIQELFQDQEDQVFYEDIYETLFQHYSNPLDLNIASRETLGSLFILSPLQINSLIEYRDNKGPLLSLYELQIIPYFDKATIQKIRPFVMVSSEKKDLSSFSQDVLTNENHYLLLRYEQIPKDSSHTGDNNKFYIKYKNSQVHNFSYGIALEKDGGEAMVWQPSLKYYGFDFLSYHVAFMNKGKIKMLVLGDFQLQFGQGLVLSSGLRLGKGSETTLTVKKNNTGVKPYSSTLESGFFRGGALTVASGLKEFTFFYSHKKIDGSLDEETHSFSPYTTGYHRTASELQKRSRIYEHVTGGNISLRNTQQNLQGGLSFVHTHYNYHLQKKIYPYNRFEFSGSYNYTVGINLNYTFQNFIFFTEVATSQSGGKGAIAGLLANISKQLEITMLSRNYERNFHSFYSNGFGENSHNANEKGIYWGLKWKPSHAWTFSCYYDRFSFPWLKYQVDAPSKGSEYLVRLAFQSHKTTLIYLQLKQEVKGKNTSKPLPLDQVMNAVKRNYMIHAETNVSSRLTLKTRLQLSSYTQNNTSFGYALVNDLYYSQKAFSLSLRFAVFESDDFENRQYVYEKDVLYAFSMPAYHGTGTRIYAILKFKVLNNTDTWIKYAVTNYKDDIEPLYMASENSWINNVRIQLRYVFH